MENFAKQIKNIAEVIKADNSSHSYIVVCFDNTINRYFFTDGNEFYADAKGNNALEAAEPWQNAHSILKSDLVNAAKSLKEGCTLQLLEGGTGIKFHVTKKNGAKETIAVKSSTRDPFPDFFNSPHCYARFKVEAENKKEFSTLIKNANALLVKEYRPYSEFLHFWFNESSGVKVEAIHGQHIAHYMFPTKNNPINGTNVCGTGTSVHIHKDHLNALAKLSDVTSADRYLEISWAVLPHDEEKPWECKENAVTAMSWFGDNIIMLRWKIKAKESIGVPSTDQIGADLKCVGRLELNGILKTYFIKMLKDGAENGHNTLVIRSGSNELEFLKGDSSRSIYCDGIVTELCNTNNNWAAEINAKMLRDLLKFGKGANIALNFLTPASNFNENTLGTLQICEGEEGKEAHYGYAWLVIRDHAEEEQ